MRKAMTVLAAAGVLAMVGCGESGSTAQTAPSGPPAWVLTSAPAGAVSVVEAKATAAEGDRVVLRARIGGRMEPITPGSPVFTVMDVSVPSCADKAHDSCPTPWDYCCEAPETIAASAATVQVVGADGSPVTDDLLARGLGPLDEVIVVGTVAARPSGEVLTVRATGVYRAGG